MVIFGSKMAIFDGKMLFTIQVLGLMLLVTLLPILGLPFGPWDALISQKCGNGSGFCPFGPFLGPKWPFLMVKCYLPFRFWALCF